MKCEGAGIIAPTEEKHHEAASGDHPETAEV